MRLAIALALVLISPGLAHGFSVKQVGQYKDQSGSYAINFDWQIGEQGFRLSTEKGSEKKIFVHNGKVFYLCGSLGKDQLQALKNLKIDDQKLMTSLEKGACQELSTDFTVRFFLSPWDAVTSADTGGGFATGLSFGEPDTSLTGKAGTAASTKCVGFKRSYELKNKNYPSMVHSVAEDACNASNIKWRQGFTRSLGMTLIRKPGGKALYTAINSDVKKMAGLSLDVSAVIEGKDNAGKAYKKSFKISASSVIPKTPEASAFSLPAGYEVIDPSNLSAIGARANFKGSAGGDSGNAFADALKFLILGGNPAAAVFKSLSDDSQKKDK